MKDKSRGFHTAMSKHMCCWKSIALRGSFENAENMHIHTTLQHMELNKYHTVWYTSQPHKSNTLNTNLRAADFSVGRVHLLCHKRWPTFQEAHQNQSLLKLFKIYIHVKAQQQAGGSKQERQR